MKLVVNKTKAFAGKIKIPGSKSHSIRALMIALLSAMLIIKISFFLLIESGSSNRN